MGIGFGIAKRFVEAGVNVLIADLNQAASEAAAERLAKGPGKVAAMQTDVSQEGSGRAVIGRCVEQFGSIDILVNNAGIYPSVPVLEATRDFFDRVYGINLKGLAFFSKNAAAQMIKQGNGGKIINIASIDAFHPSSVGLAFYDASKGGVVMFTKNFALEVAPHGINVNAIAPGAISTEGTAKPLDGGMTQEQMDAMMAAFAARIPMKRQGNPDDIAKVALFLASPASDYVVGETIIVDGGFLLT
jgi:2-deoxy-D-gluconate 3-dehydrogenase